MKKDGAGAVFTAVGTVVGAGFVSGRELLQFFGCFRLSAVWCAGILFFAGFLLFMRLGRRFGGFEGALKGVFGRFSRPVKWVILFGSFVSCAGMLSASNALEPQAKPFLSLAFLVVACLVSERGMKGIGVLNLAIVPLVLVCVTVLVASRGALSRPESPEVNFPALLSVVLYVCLNVFLSMPVLCELGAHTKEGGAGLCAAAALIIAAAIGLILSAVCSDKNSYPCDLPLAYILNGAKLFSLLASGGMLTTLISSFYPLYAPAGRRLGFWGKAGLFAAAELCSFIRFGRIVAEVYPMLGIFGVFVTLASGIVWLKGSVSFRRRAPRRPIPAGKQKREKVFIKDFIKEQNDFY